MRVAFVGLGVMGYPMAGLLLRGTRPFGDVARFDARFRSRIWRICVAAIVMGGALWTAKLAMGQLLYTYLHLV